MRLLPSLLLGLLLGVTSLNAQSFLQADTTFISCGGIFLDAGDSTGNYPSSSSTTTTICSDSNCLVVDFAQFKLSNNDVLEIYEGPNTAFPKIGTFAGTSSPGKIHSRNTCLTFVFTSDSSISDSGWSALVSCDTCPTPTMVKMKDSLVYGCNFTITDSDAGLPSGNYSHNENSILTICPSTNGFVEISFSQFQVELCCDLLRLFDGIDTTGQLLGSYAGFSKPPNNISTSGCLTFHFKSDGLINGTGWVSTAQCLLCPINPSASFSAIDSCNFIFFQDQSIAKPPVTYYWSFGDSTTSNLANPKHAYAGPGIYNICLTVTDSCGNSDTTCQNLNAPLTNAAFTATSSLNVASFNNQSSSDSLATWLWDFGDGDTSTLHSPTHSYASFGSYLVCLSVLGYCDTAIFCDTVDITCPKPSAAFSETSTLLKAVFINNSSTQSNANWFWTFGDGASSSAYQPVHNYSQAGTYNVCLITIDTCATDTFCDSITITCPMPTAKFNVHQNDSSIIFENVSSHSQVPIWHWTLGDGNSFNTKHPPQHIYSKNGTFKICLWVTDTCGSDSVCKNVTVNTYVGYEEVFSTGVRVYPNPSEGMLTIQIPEKIEGIQLVIIDLHGKTQIEFESGTNKGSRPIEFETTLNPGTYFLIAKSESQISTKKIIILPKQ